MTGNRISLNTPNAALQLGYSGWTDGFIISIGNPSRGSYSYVDGFFKNHDFPGEAIAPDRGEIFYIKADAEHQQNMQTLVLDALRLMKANDCTKFSISDSSPMERSLMTQLEQRGFISLQRRSTSGKSEYSILAGVRN